MIPLHRLWDRTPFIGRLLATASTALLAAAAAMLFFSARQEAEEIRADLRMELQKELETLPAALVEVVVIGDFSTLQQTLDRYVTRPLVTTADFRDLSGVRLHSEDERRAPDVPAWFLRLLDFGDVSGSAQVYRQR